MMDKIFKEIIEFIHSIYGKEEFIPLHEPRFIGREKEYVNRAIESTFVSSVGQMVGKFEQEVARYTGSAYAIATVNGTSALHLALLLAGVEPESEVITQALTFVATANAILYTGAHPVFLDIAPDTLSLDPGRVEDFLKKNAWIKTRNGKLQCYNKQTGRRIAACVPVHTFGHPARIDELVEICSAYHIPVVEDAAESLGTFYKGRHTGTFGLLGVLSFNGNKIITTGSGGMILTDDKDLAERARHLSTQAKVPHQWEYYHDQVGYNYRLTNLQAALGLAQMENLEMFVQKKRWLAAEYAKFFSRYEQIEFFSEPAQARSNYWLNVIMLPDLNFRDKFLKLSNTSGVMTRAAWRPMHMLPSFERELRDSLEITEQFYQKIVCLPSSVVV